VKFPPPPLGNFFVDEALTMNDGAAPVSAAGLASIAGLAKEVAKQLLSQTLPTGEQPRNEADTDDLACIAPKPDEPLDSIARVLTMLSAAPSTVHESACKQLSDAATEDPSADKLRSAAMAVREGSLHNQITPKMFEGPFYEVRTSGSTAAVAVASVELDNQARLVGLRAVGAGQGGAVMVASLATIRLPARAGDIGHTDPAVAPLGAELERRHAGGDLCGIFVRGTAGSVGNGADGAHGANAHAVAWTVLCARETIARAALKSLFCAAAHAHSSGARARLEQEWAARAPEDAARRQQRQQQQQQAPAADIGGELNCLDLLAKLPHGVRPPHTNAPRKAKLDSLGAFSGGDSSADYLYTYWKDAAVFHLAKTMPDPDTLFRHGNVCPARRAELEANWPLVNLLVQRYLNMKARPIKTLCGLLYRRKGSGGGRDMTALHLQSKKRGQNLKFSPELGARDLLGALHLEERVFWAIHDRGVRSKQGRIVTTVEAGLWTLLFHMKYDIRGMSNVKDGWTDITPAEDADWPQQCRVGEVNLYKYHGVAKDGENAKAHVVLWVNGLGNGGAGDIGAFWALCVLCRAAPASFSHARPPACLQRAPRAPPPSSRPPAPPNPRSISTDLTQHERFQSARACLHAVLDSDSDTLRTSTVSLAGHSLGGAIAIKLAELEGLHADAFNPAPLLASTKAGTAAAVVLGRLFSSFAPFVRATYGFVRRHFLADRQVSAWDVALPSSGRLGSFADEAYDYMSSKLTCAHFDGARGGTATVHHLLGDPASGCYLRSELGVEVLRYPNLGEHTSWASDSVEGYSLRGAHQNHLTIAMFPPVADRPAAVVNMADLQLTELDGPARTSQTVTLADAVKATSAYVVHNADGDFGILHRWISGMEFSEAKTVSAKRAAWSLARNAMFT